MYKETLLKKARTNNLCEGFHSAENAKTRGRMSLYKSVDRVRLQIVRFEKMIIR